LAASGLKTAFRSGGRLRGTIYFGEERFPVELIVDVSDPLDGFMVLTRAHRDRGSDYCPRSAAVPSWRVL